MKQSIKAKFKTFVLFLVGSFYYTLAWTQDSSVTTNQVTNTTITTHEWYTQPWVWIVAGAVFILLLVTLLRSNSNTTDKVTVTKTVKTDRDTV